MSPSPLGPNDVLQDDNYFLWEFNARMMLTRKDLLNHVVLKTEEAALQGSAEWKAADLKALVMLIKLLGPTYHSMLRKQLHEFAMAAGQVMSPTQASPTDDRDFPRLNGRNFVIWKTRATAALEGKNLIGFVTQADYARESESDFSDDDELDPKYSKFFTAEDNQAVKKTLDEIGAPSADAPSSSSSEASDDSTAVANEDGDGDVEMDQENLPSEKTPYEIFTTLCAMYEATAIHGDPYYIMNYLMALKNEEVTDLNKFIYEMEERMKAASDTTNSVMADEQKTIYLYHALPDVWKERNASILTRETTRIAVETAILAAATTMATETTTTTRATDATTIVDAPTAMAIKASTSFAEGATKKATALTGASAITTLDLTPMKNEISLTAQDVPHDPAWTIDSRCTRHVTSSPHWFEDLKTIIGKTITVGGNHQIPILGTGTVNMTVTDTKGSKRIISLSDVLYSPELKFNLLSVRQPVDGNYKINFPNAKICVLFYAHRTKFEARTGEGTNLYQFKALPTDSDQATHVANTGSG
uniref:Retrovirus-related Pol polyprotein from transposon TNT 1-94-like beta-barrel domain-containing protein n=1 Tax=Phytophthora ramorum TaxID=164328 RepID=H3GNJ4_PHYRM